MGGDKVRQMCLGRRVALDLQQRCERWEKLVEGCPEILTGPYRRLGDAHVGDDPFLQHQRIQVGQARPAGSRPLGVEGCPKVLDLRRLGVVDMDREHAAVRGYLLHRAQEADRVG